VSPCRAGTLCCQAAGRSLADFGVFSRRRGNFMPKLPAPKSFSSTRTYPAGNFSGLRHGGGGKPGTIIAEILFSGIISATMKSTPFAFEVIALNGRFGFGVNHQRGRFPAGILRNQSSREERSVKLSKLLILKHDW